MAAAAAAGSAGTNSELIKTLPSPGQQPGHKDDTGTAINNKTLILLMITKLNIGSI